MQSELSDSELNFLCGLCPTENSEFECMHDNLSGTNASHGSSICLDCGEFIDDPMIETNQYRYLSNDKFKKPHRRNDERSIIKDIQAYNFPFEVKDMANKLYMIVTKGNIKRGKNRRGLIFACIYNTYIKLNEPKTIDELLKIFQLTKKDVSKGLSIYNLANIDDGLVPVIPFTLHIKSLLDKFTTQTEAKIDQNNQIPSELIFDDINVQTSLDELIILYRRIHNKTSILNRANPLSIIASLIFYYLKIIQKKDIKPDDFCKIVSLSESTINKIIKDIDQVLKKPIE